MIGKKYIVFFSLLSIGFTSCISIKRTVYLQDKSQADSYKAVFDTTFTQQLPVYKIQNGDVLFVEINRYKITDLEEGPQPVNLGADNKDGNYKGFIVRNDGAIDLPLMGKIEVKGSSLEEAREKIYLLASEYYSNPSVKLFLLNNYITVLGEVYEPGRYAYFGEAISILDAIGLAGDCTDYAEKEIVKVMRNINGKTHIYFLDLTDVTSVAKEGFYLMPNDIVMVKAQNKKRFDTRDFQFITNGITSIVSIAISLYIIKTN